MCQASVAEIDNTGNRQQTQVQAIKRSSHRQHLLCKTSPGIARATRRMGWGLGLQQIREALQAWSSRLLVCCMSANCPSPLSKRLQRDRGWRSGVICIRKRSAIKWEGSPSIEDSQPGDQLKRRGGAYSGWECGTEEQLQEHKVETNMTLPAPL
jgi:hypothetical protein